MQDKKYHLPTESILIINKSVIQHFKNYVQEPKDKKRESGGQLFSHNPHKKNVVIDRITGPYISDKSSRYSWKPDVQKMSKDRENLFEEQYYIVGLWHTHPEGYPKSSNQDKKTCRKHLDLLEENYNGFLLCTMGYENLLVEYLDRSTMKWYKLIEVKG